MLQVNEIGGKVETAVQSTDPCDPIGGSWAKILLTKGVSPTKTEVPESMMALNPVATEVPLTAAASAFSTHQASSAKGT